MGKKRVFVSLLAISIGILAACGTESKTGAEKAKNSEGKYELNVGYSQSGGAPLLDIGIAEGYFEEEGVTVNPIGFASSADGLNALQAGKIDIGLSFGTAGPLTFIANGSDFSIIGGHLEGGHPILVKEENKHNYHSLEDYKGKKVGTIRIFTSDIVFRSALEEAGIDWKKDLEIVEFKTGSNLLEAVASGKVDVAVAANSVYPKALEAGLVAIGWSNDLNPGHVCCRVVTRTELLDDEDGEAYKRFLKALIRAERTKVESPEKAVAAAKPHFKFDDETIDQIVNEEHSHYSADPNQNGVLKMWEQMQEIGYVEDVEEIQLNEYINIHLFEEALNELAKEHPDDPYYKEQQTKFKEQNA